MRFGEEIDMSCRGLRINSRIGSGHRLDLLSTAGVQFEMRCKTDVKVQLFFWRDKFHRPVLDLTRGTAGLSNVTAVRKCVITHTKTSPQHSNILGSTLEKKPSSAGNDDIMILDHVKYEFGGWVARAW